MLILAQGRVQERNRWKNLQRPFAGLPAGAQRIVLLMRALVGCPPIVLLDEVWSGMDAFVPMRC